MRVRHLADYVIARHYPEAVDATNRYRSAPRPRDRAPGRACREMAARRLHSRRHEYRQHVDRWRDHRLRPLRLHGHLRSRTVYSSIDTVGRYAYGNQPRIAQWNLARLAETLLPLLAEDKEAAVARRERGPRRVRQPLRDGLRRRSPAQAWLVGKTTGRSVTGAGSPRPHGPQRRGLHLDLPPAVRRGRQLRR